MLRWESILALLKHLATCKGSTSGSSHEGTRRVAGCNAHLASLSRGHMTHAQPQCTAAAGVGPMCGSGLIGSPLPLDFGPLTWLAFCGVKQPTAILPLCFQTTITRCRAIGTSMRGAAELQLPSVFIYSTASLNPKRCTRAVRRFRHLLLAEALPKLQKAAPTIAAMYIHTAHSVCVILSSRPDLQPTLLSPALTQSQKNATTNRPPIPPTHHEPVRWPRHLCSRPHPPLPHGASCHHPDDHNGHHPSASASNHQACGTRDPCCLSHQPPPQSSHAAGR